MADAKLSTTTAKLQTEVDAKVAEFSASGTVVLFKVLFLIHF